MVAIREQLACAQCGADAPYEADELVQWKYGRLALTYEFADIIGSLLLCPTCVVQEHEHDFDEGGDG